MQTATVGGNVDSWCTKCKLMLAHTVETVVAGKITRVHCNTCGGQHALRRRPPGASLVRGRARSTASGGALRAAAPALGASDYPTLVRGRDATTARRYAFTELFNKNELINHSSFGLGLVTADKGGNKIEVLFPDGVKVLVHNR